MDSVLVAIATYDQSKYCRSELIKSLEELAYKDLDILFVTNSGEEDKQDLFKATAKLRMKRKITILVNDPGDAQPHDVVVKNRNTIRDAFLKGSWEWLFLLDDDVLVEPDATERLLADKKILMAAPVLTLFSYAGKPRVLPILAIADTPGRVRQLALLDVLVPRLFKVATASLGCCLIRRPVVEAVTFRRLEHELPSEDTAFFLDAKSHGYEPWCDTRIRTQHLKWIPSDKRNKMLDPKNYKVALKKLQKK